MERMPLTRAMGLALECFLNIIPSKGMIFRKIFPTSRHSFHVCWIVRKAILNEPKPFGYFWASKVTKRIGIHEYPRVLVNLGFKSKRRVGIHEQLHRFVYFSAKK
ncbi:MULTISPECIES: hypothetical protein [unclassified Sphingobacterium]|uniref:hypothetical protein n=1 Tax=unclassified Sphingobacterium TaxID=2609468 RepID=UPI0020C577BE|nr:MULTISPECIES: hypothetical protein [unclassified Sphingobacterium]